VREHLRQSLGVAGYGGQVKGGRQAAAISISAWLFPFFCLFWRHARQLRSPEYQ
jgi:hypothetical protein